jgi:hypothetical protein
MRFRIQLVTLMRIRILIFIFDAGPDAHPVFKLGDRDADPGYQNDADPSGSTTLRTMSLSQVHSDHDL